MDTSSTTAISGENKPPTRPTTSSLSTAKNVTRSWPWAPRRARSSRKRLRPFGFLGVGRAECRGCIGERGESDSFQGHCFIAPNPTDYRGHGSSSAAPSEHRKRVAARLKCDSGFRSQTAFGGSVSRSLTPRCRSSSTTRSRSSRRCSNSTSSSRQLALPDWRSPSQNDEGHMRPSPDRSGFTSKQDVPMLPNNAARVRLPQ